MSPKSVEDVDVRGKRVFCRVDFNVPLGESGEVEDDTRIRRSIPTIIDVTGRGGKCILASHLGRPKGERKPEMSLRPVAARLGALLGTEVGFSEDCVGEKARNAVGQLSGGDVLVLENLRFHAEETANDPGFAEDLAALTDVYVNDAFGTAHRAHASTVGVAALVDEKAAGLLLKDELENLGRALSNPEKPVVGIFGGAKVSDKLGVLLNLLDRMDTVLIGGGMANTFLRAQGLNMGSSKMEQGMIETAEEILEAAKKAGCSLVLPVDLVVADRMEAGASTSVVGADGVGAGQMALDIGPKTADLFKASIAGAGTIVWNGPMGVFEMEGFASGTRSVASAVGSASGFSVVGGGDTVRAVKEAGVESQVSYISTGGGAFMEFMEGKTLPGVAAL